MSSSALKLLAASGAKGGATYVDDVFSTFLYEGTGVAQGIQNGINLGDFGRSYDLSNRLLQIVRNRSFLVRMFAEFAGISGDRRLLSLSFAEFFRNSQQNLRYFAKMQEKDPGTI